jgi:SAM-dependent methyltransferase
MTPGGRDVDKIFAGSIPAFYDSYLVPLIFEPYAQDLAARLKSRDVSSVLELAAGTGVVTRALASALPHSVSIIATDLNQAMIDHAATLPIDRPVQWQQADAMDLPFGDEMFDAVVFQFGAMFIPDRPKAYAEALRVLRPGGVFLFNVWDRISENEFADIVTTSLESVFPDDPPRFLARTPHGYHDRRMVEADILKAGFGNPPHIDTVAARSRAPSPQHPAIAYCQGTPLRNEIESRDASKLERATEVGTEAIAERFGRGPVDGKIQAHVITVER